MSDRTLRAPADLDRLDFQKEAGLVTVVAQDVATGDVLMVARANRAALAASLETGDLHLWSRTREELWRKGATSGNVLRVASLRADCDGDTVLALVRPDGPACHTGERTCFGEGTSPRDLDGTLAALARVVEARARDRPARSYTVRLLDDQNLRIKKLGEETAELVAALAAGDAEAIGQEAADLVYHLLVALVAAGLTPADLAAVLEARAG